MAHILTFPKRNVRADAVKLLRDRFWRGLISWPEAKEEILSLGFSAEQADGILSGGGETGDPPR